MSGEGQFIISEFTLGTLVIWTSMELIGPAGTQLHFGDSMTGGRLGSAQSLCMGRASWITGIQHLAEDGGLKVQS